MLLHWLNCVSIPADLASTQRHAETRILWNHRRCYPDYFTVFKNELMDYPAQEMKEIYYNSKQGNSRQYFSLAADSSVLRHKNI